MNPSWLVYSKLCFHCLPDSLAYHLSHFLYSYSPLWRPVLNSWPQFKPSLYSLPVHLTSHTCVFYFNKEQSTKKFQINRINRSTSTLTSVLDCILFIFFIHFLYLIFSFPSYILSVGKLVWNSGLDIRCRNSWSSQCFHFSLASRTLGAHHVLQMSFIFSGVSLLFFANSGFHIVVDLAEVSSRGLEDAFAMEKESGD